MNSLGPDTTLRGRYLYCPHFRDQRNGTHRRATTCQQTAATEWGNQSGALVLSDSKVYAPILFLKKVDDSLMHIWPSFTVLPIYSMGDYCAPNTCEVL